VAALVLTTVIAGRSHAASEDPDAVVETRAALSSGDVLDERPVPRLKLSLEGFSIGTTWGAPVGLTGLHAEVYPLSRPWIFAGVGLTGGVGNAQVDAASASLVYGLLGVSVGVQYPARITPFVEGHLAGGFMGATLDRPITVAGVTVANASGTTWLVTRGLDAGGEFYVLGRSRAYVAVSLGWMRSSWASPDLDPNAVATSSGGLRVVTVTSDSFLWKVGLGI
jgi:hypothetical protein